MSLTTKQERRLVKQELFARCLANLSADVRLRSTPAQLRQMARVVMNKILAGKDPRITHVQRVP